MASNFIKKIIICADDFGISPGVSKGILKLAGKNKISATSVMVCFKDWSQEAKPLIDFQKQIDIGLHFTLTGAVPLSKPQEISSLVNANGNFVSFSQFIKKCFFKQINPEEVKREFFKQFDRFIEFFGFAPHYIDSHHNVHQYPVINEALFNSLDKKFNGNKFYVRNTAVPLNKAIRQGINLIKIIPINLLGKEYKNFLESNETKTNSSFMGIYDWRRPINFGKNFKRFLKTSSEENGIIMTHPGLPDNLLRKRDSFNDGREIEFNYLNEIDIVNNFKPMIITPSKFKF